MTKKRKQQSRNDLRVLYKKIFNREPPVRLGRVELKKRIREKQVLDAHYEQQRSKEAAELATPPGPTDRKPEFEELAAEPEPEPVHFAADESGDIGPEKTHPGPLRGQTYERARIERILRLQVPDLIVKKLVFGLCLVLGRVSGIPFTEKQGELLALGVTRELYYWFPDAQGNTTKWALHAQALDDITKPLYERSQRQEPEQDQPEPETDKEIDNDEEKEQVSKKVGKKVKGKAASKAASRAASKTARKAASRSHK